MPPEVFMQCVRLGGAPLNAWLAETLGTGEPNAVHAVLAWALDHDAPVWSLNVDELIESVPATADEDPSVARTRRGDRVAQRQAERSSDPEPPPPPSPRLYKPHGTLSRRNFIFRTDQVLYPLAPSWADRFLDEVDGSELVVIGYAGADIDMRAALTRAVEAAATVRWFTLDTDWQKTCRSLPGLERRSGVEAIVSRYKNPSHDFLDWADACGLAGYVTPHQRAEIDHVEWEVPKPPPGPARASRAYLYERMSEPERAASDFSATMRHVPPGRLELRSATRLAKIHWYAQGRHGGLWHDGFALVRAFDREVLGRGPRQVSVAKLRRAHIMWLSSVSGDHRTALRLALTARKDDPATFIVRAKSCRYLGRTTDALDAAERAYALAVPSDPRRIPRPDEAAHATFEQVYALIWLGRLNEAEVRLAALYAGLDGQAAARWIGWSRYLRGGLALLHHDTSTARDELEDARAYFASDDDGGRRAMAREVLLYAVHRMEGTVAETLRPPGGSLPVMSQLRATAVIEHAEAARASHDYAAASAAYENLASWHARPLLSTAALIALAEIEIACGRHPGELLYRARHQADHAAYLPLQAELLVTEGRAGIRDQDATFELLDEVSSAVTPEHLDELRRLAADGTANHSLYCIW